MDVWDSHYMRKTRHDTVSARPTLWYTCLELNGTSVRLVYVRPGNVKVVSKECPFGKLRLCDDEDLCEIFFADLSRKQLNSRQPLDTKFVYGIAPLHGNAIILDLGQYCLHQTASSSLIEDDITAQKQKGSQLDVFLCSHPSATRYM